MPAGIVRGYVACDVCRKHRVAQRLCSWWCGGLNALRRVKICREEEQAE